ncbi:hypothetical protein C8J56DRAFT_927158 [Mycena floridula]|nr:hypothetical protein C8J56DRAFT_927158 [Mycena floridula]
MSFDQSEGFINDFLHRTQENDGNSLRVRETDGNSLRTELLSNTTHAADRVVHSHNRRGPSDRFRRERELAYSQYPEKELLRLLIERDYEVQRHDQTVDILMSKIEAERAQASDAKQSALLGRQRAQQAEQARNAALDEAQKAKEELLHYRHNYTMALAQIEQAKELLKAIEAQRDEAERKGAESRSLARQLDRERKVVTAREEGRQAGFEAGFKRAQEEFQMAGTANGLHFDTSIVLPRLYSRDYATNTQASRSRRDDAVSERTVSTFQRLPPVLALQSNPMPMPRAPSISREQQPPSEPVQQPEPITEPVPHPYAESTAYAQSINRESINRARTPLVEHYEVEVPTSEAIETAEAVKREYQRNSQIRDRQGPSIIPAPWPSTTYQQPRPPSRAASPRPPDNWIPLADPNGMISIPPPNELHDMTSPSGMSVRQLPEDNRSISGSVQSKGKGKARQQPWYGAASGSNAGGFELEKQQRQGAPSIASTSNKHHRRSSVPVGMSSTNPGHGRGGSIDSTTNFDYAPRQRRELSIINESSPSRHGSGQQRPTSIRGTEAGSEYAPSIPPKDDRAAGKRRAPPDVYLGGWNDQINAQNMRRAPSIGSDTRSTEIAAPNFSRRDRSSDVSSPTYNIRVEPPSQPPSGNPISNTREQGRYLDPDQISHRLSLQPDVPTEPNTPVNQTRPLWGNVGESSQPFRPASVHSRRPGSILSAVSGRKQSRSHEKASPASVSAPLPVAQESVLRRVPSNLSTRSGASYAKFDQSTYLDPSLFTSGEAPPGRPRSRAGSVVSDFEYVSDRRSHHA